MDRSGPEEPLTLGDLAGVTAAILAGGLGTRLRPVLADRPKVLAEIRGRPFLAYLLDQLASLSIKHVVVCTGYKGEQVRAAFRDTYSTLHVVYSQESAPLGTAGALRLALPLFKSDPVLVMNGDSFCEFDLKAFWTMHHTRAAKATLALVRMTDTKRYGQVHVDTDGVVVSFDEKGTRGNPGWINAGIYLLTRSLLSTIPANHAVSLEQDMFPSWTGRGLYGYQSPGRFLDIGTPEAYTTAERFFAMEKPV